MTLLPPELIDSRTYDFNVLRYILAGAFQEGVLLDPAASSLQVVPGTTGLRVTHKAGRGFIAADFGTRNGVYHQVNDADVTDAITLDPADPTNPRVDTLWLATADSTDLNTAGDVATLGVTKGNPSAGAQAWDPAAANYRAGAGAPPASAMWLADVRIPNGFTGPLVAASAVGTGHIVDRRRRADGFRRTVGGVTANPLIGTTLGQLFEMALNGDFSGRPVEVFFEGDFYPQSSATYVQTAIYVDGVQLPISAGANGYVLGHNIFHHWSAHQVNGVAHATHMNTIYGLPPGRHTIAIFSLTPTASNMSWYSVNRTLRVEEVVADSPAM